MKDKITTFIKRAKSWSWWLNWFGIFAGCLLMSIGFVYFINPYNIVPGGVYGTSIVLHNLFPSIQVGTFGYMMDIPLMIISIFLLGSSLGSRTIIAALVSPTLMNILSELSYPTQEALHALDPAQLLGGYINMSDDLMLTTLLGSVLIGVGVGLVVRSQATTGGSDIIAMIMQKYLHIPFSKGVLLVDGMVVLFGLLVIGMGLGGGQADSSSWLLSFYSLIAIFVSSRVMAYVLTGSKNDKMLFIITSQPVDMFRKHILEIMERTATCIPCQGMYSNSQKNTLLIVAKNKEVLPLQHFIKKIDPTAFVVVTDAYDTYGEGWQVLPSPGEVVAK